MLKTSETHHCSNLGLDNLDIVLDTTLEAQNEWFEIGLSLGLPVVKLVAIRKENVKQQDCLRETLHLWLKGVDPPPNWEGLVCALRRSAVNQHRLAKCIEEKYCSVGEHNIATNFLDRRVMYSEHHRRLYQEYAPERMLQWPELPHYEFVTLAMIKRDKLRYGEYDKFVKETLHGDADDIMRQKDEINLECIFETTTAKHKVILIEGAPGAGKTMLVWYICREWGRKKLFIQFWIIVLATLRDPTVQEAKSITDVVPNEDQFGAQNVALEMKSCQGKGVLFILDGWDELPEQKRKSNTFLFRQLIEQPEKHSLDEAAIVVTSRPVSSGDLRRFASSRIEIVGFISSKIKEYFETCLKSEEEHSKKLNSLLQTVADNPLIGSICYLPLNAAIVVYLFCACDCVLPNTYYELFQLLVYHCLKRYAGKNGINIVQHKQPAFEYLPQEIKKPFEQICKLAYLATREELITFCPKTLNNFGIEEPLNHLGLMQSVQSLLKHGQGTTYHFLHLSLQELLAAYHISKLRPDDQVKVFKAWLDSPRFSSVFGFYAGFTKLQCKEVRDVVAEIVQTERRKSEEKTLLVSLINWLYEAQDPELCEFVQRELTRDQSEQLNEGAGLLNLSYTSLKPSDALSIGYFLSTVGTAHGKHFCVDLSYCSLEDHHVKFLVKGLSYCQQTMNKAHVKMNLSFNNINTEGIHHLANFLKKSEVIQTLNLRKNKCFHICQLFKALETNTSFTELDISQCSLQLTEKAGVSLRDMLTKNHSLQCLNISHYKVSPEYIVDSLSVCGLKTLHMTNCNVTAVEMKQISVAIKGSKLKELSLGPVYDNCMEPLANATSLQSLSLSGWVVTDQGLQIFGDALRENNSLHELILQDFHSVTSKGLTKLAEQLTRNQTIEILAIIRFTHSSISEGLKNLVSCLEQNSTLKLLKLSEYQATEIKEMVCKINNSRQPPLKVEHLT